MKETTTCNTFNSILNTIHEEGITTKDALMTNQLLYAEFWYALKDFCCNFALLSKTSGKNAEGETLPGNAVKIDVLELKGETTREDIETECMLKIIDKLDYVLRQPLGKQRNYCYKICNNLVNDYFRSMPKEAMFVPLNGTVTGTNADHVYTYVDVIPDHTYDPGHVLTERETIQELAKMLRAKRAKELAEQKAKQAQELAEKRKDILRELPKLSTHAPEVFARLGRKYLGIKTSELATRIINDGYENTFAQVIIDVAKKYDIPLEDIRNTITVTKLTEESYKKDKGLVKLLSRNHGVVADQLSKYANRAKGRLDEQPDK